MKFFEIDKQGFCFCPFCYVGMEVTKKKVDSDKFCIFDNIMEVTKIGKDGKKEKKFISLALQVEPLSFCEMLKVYKFSTPVEVSFYGPKKIFFGKASIFNGLLFGRK